MVTCSCTPQRQTGDSGWRSAACRQNDQIGFCLFVCSVAINNEGENALQTIILTRWNMPSWSRRNIGFIHFLASDPERLMQTERESGIEDAS
jgi:hypothetical protein